MGDNAERAVEETAQLMEGIRKAKLLSKFELSNVTRRRRDYEYQLVAPKPRVTSFLEYASFERDLSELLKKRSERKGIKKSRAKFLIHRSSSRVGLVYSRAVRRFKGDVDLWLHYARYLIGAGTHRAAGNVLGRALAMRPDSEKIWLAIIALHADNMGDPGGARKLAMRALRNLPESSQLWVTYYRVELAFLCKAIARRVAMKLPVPGGEEDDVDIAAEESALKNTAGDKDASEDKEMSPASNVSAEDASIDVQKDVSSAGEDVAEKDEDDTNENDDEVIDVDADEFDENKEAEAMADSDENEDEASGNDDDNAESDDLSETKTDEPATSRALKFWHGGIPLAVFRRAKNQIKLTNEQLVEYWRAAVDMPFAPWQLVNHIYGDMSNDEVVSKLIAARLEFDIAMAKRNHISAPSEEYETASEVAKTNTETACAQICELLENMNIKTSTGVEEIVHAFGKRAGNWLNGTQQQRLIGGLKALKERGAANQDEDDNENMSLKEVCDSGTLKAWTNYLNRNLSANTAEKDKIRRELQSRILVPLRSAEKDGIAIEWLRWEGNDDREVVVGLVKSFLKIPPVSQRLLREFIPALKRVKGPWELRRKLYDMICMKNVADVDMWVEYTEFERDVVKDNAKSNAVVWKAKKALTDSKAQLYEEKLCVRLLAR